MKIIKKVDPAKQHLWYCCVSALLLIGIFLCFMSATFSIFSGDSSDRKNHSNMVLSFVMGGIYLSIIIYLIRDLKSEYSSYKKRKQISLAEKSKRANAKMVIVVKFTVNLSVQTMLSAIF